MYGSCTYIISINKVLHKYSLLIGMKKALTGTIKQCLLTHVFWNVIMLQYIQHMVEWVMGGKVLDLKKIVASCLYDGTWAGNAETENQRNFLKVRKKLNKFFVERYGEKSGYKGWWLDGTEIWRADWEGRESSMVCLHLKKQEEKEDILFYGVEGLKLKGDLQLPGSQWAAEILLLAFADEHRELQCALVCREGLTMRMHFSKVISVEKDKISQVQ